MAFASGSRHSGSVAGTKKLGRVALAVAPRVRPRRVAGRTNHVAVRCRLGPQARPAPELSAMPWTRRDDGMVWEYEGSTGVAVEIVDLADSELISLERDADHTLHVEVRLGNDQLAHLAFEWCASFTYTMVRYLSALVTLAAVSTLTIGRRSTSSRFGFEWKWLGLPNKKRKRPPDLSDGRSQCAAQPGIRSPSRPGRRGRGRRRRRRLPSPSASRRREPRWSA